jgi:hypothetical protein
MRKILKEKEKAPEDFLAGAGMVVGGRFLVESIKTHRLNGLVSLSRPFFSIYPRLFPSANAPQSP